MFFSHFLSSRVVCSQPSSQPAAYRSPLVTGLRSQIRTRTRPGSPGHHCTQLLLRRVPSQRVPRSVLDLGGSTGPVPSPPPAAASTKPCPPRSGGHKVAPPCSSQDRPCRSHRRQCLWGRAPSCSTEPSLHRATLPHPPCSGSCRSCWLRPSALCHLHRHLSLPVPLWPGTAGTGRAAPTAPGPRTTAPAPWDLGPGGPAWGRAKEVSPLPRRSAS